MGCDGMAWIGVLTGNAAGVKRNPGYYFIQGRQQAGMLVTVSRCLMDRVQLFLARVGGFPSRDFRFACGSL